MQLFKNVASLKSQGAMSMDVFPRSENEKKIKYPIKFNFIPLLDPPSTSWWICLPQLWSNACRIYQSTMRICRVRSQLSLVEQEDVPFGSKSRTWNPKSALFRHHLKKWLIWFANKINWTSRHKHSIFVDSQWVYHCVVATQVLHKLAIGELPKFDIVCRTRSKHVQSWM